MLDFHRKKEYNRCMRFFVKGGYYEKKATVALGTSKAFQPTRVYYFADFGADRVHGRFFDLLYTTCLAERFADAFQRDHRTSPFVAAGESCV